MKVEKDYLAFTITEDMLIEGLKGNELVVFAFIEHQCSHSKDGCYDEGISNICRIFDLSQPTVVKIIKNLVEYRLIEKTYFLDQFNQRRCSLRVIG